MLNKIRKIFEEIGNVSSTIGKNFGEIYVNLKKSLRMIKKKVRYPTPTYEEISGKIRGNLTLFW